MFGHSIAVFLTCLGLLAGNARADDASALFARDKLAAGGVRWDAVLSLETRGMLRAGGLEGSFRSLQDFRYLRTVSHYRLGPVEGADGYDGEHGWSQDPGGEVALLDAPAARRRLRSQAWLDAHGYWYPQRFPAQFGDPSEREVDGRRLVVVEATPQGGDTLTLWFDPASHHLVRVTQKQDQDTVTTSLDNWRSVDGLTLPFHVRTDLTDAAGRTDPRRRTEVQIEGVKTNIAVADADFAAPAMRDTARIKSVSGITSLPFDLVNNHIYVDGTIDGNPARLLVDTGGVNLLTPAAARKFGLVAEGKLAARGVGEHEVDLALAHAGEVRVGDAILTKPVFYVVDLGDLPAVEGVVADGLVGYEMFRRFGVTIDYAKRELTLAEPARFVPPMGAHAVPFEQAERIPVISATLDGLPIRASIDTGSRSSLTLHSPFVHEHHLIARYGAAAESVVGWGVGGPNRGRPARFGRLKLGDLAIDAIAGDLYTGDKGSFASPDLAANIGGGTLKRFTVAFDYGQKLMYLAPNQPNPAPDAYDRSGLWLLAGNHSLQVADVAAGSAAAKAGFKLGDAITAIDGKAVAVRTLAQWRERLRELPAGTRLAFDFRREGKSGRAELVLADRIPARVQ